MEKSKLFFSVIIVINIFTFIFNLVGSSSLLLGAISLLLSTISFVSLVSLIKNEKNSN